MKSIHLPITIQKIADYFVRYSELKGSDYRDWDTVEFNLITECERLTTIRINAGWKVTDRSKTGITTKLMDYIREEWVSGKFAQISPIRRQIAECGQNCLLSARGPLRIEHAVDYFPVNRRMDWYHAT